MKCREILVAIQICLCEKYSPFVGPCNYECTYYKYFFFEQLLTSLVSGIYLGNRTTVKYVFKIILVSLCMPIGFLLLLTIIHTRYIEGKFSYIFFSYVSVWLGQKQFYVFENGILPTYED